jgi:oxygen-dependent protoporphyrinogen oxidase
VERLARDPYTGRFDIACGSAARIEADLVVLACPSKAAASLVAPWDPRLAGVAHVGEAACATVHLAYPRSALRRPLSGYGFFVGRSEGLPILACSYVSSKFPDRAPGEQVLLRAFLGGARNPEALDHGDDSLARLAHRSLAALLDIEGAPLTARTYRGALPQFPVGCGAALAAAREAARCHPGFALAGAALGTVGLPDCVASGEEAARQALETKLAAPRSLPLAASGS